MSGDSPDDAPDEPCSSCRLSTELRAASLQRRHLLVIVMTAFAGSSLRFPYGYGYQDFGVGGYGEDPGAEAHPRVDP
ncbi:hypothetical protein [Salinigranum halophilum]|jgi:hypothetical protein|uniref:hypothetical protein n=1 Tax=Salinigranum halophilum TaxID=2565931 RepID=UPI0010A8A64F|nr:hypothetical protein [Salinigranum halophilum]